MILFLFQAHTHCHTIQSISATSSPRILREEQKEIQVLQMVRRLLPLSSFLSTSISNANVQHATYFLFDVSEKPLM